MKTYKLDKNGHPTPEACRAVAAQIRNALKKYPEMKLDMDQCNVKYEGLGQEDEYHHACGTTHCHAGVFLLGSDDLDDDRCHISYSEGMFMIAKMLGFIDPDDNYSPRLGLGDKIQCWAATYPLRWGNYHGNVMFSGEQAFDGATNVSQIADWWDGVADRSEKLNSYKEES